MKAETNKHNTIRIVIVNLKGGVGKTTIATNTAHHYNALLVDLDPQGDAADWAKRSGLVRAVHAPNWQDATDIIDEEPGAVVVDCPPGEGPALRAALTLANIAIVPTKSSAADLRAIGRMIHLADDAKRVNPDLIVGLILNEAKTFTHAAQETEKDLRKLTATNFLGTISSRQAIPDALTTGTAIPSGPARTEFEAVFAKLNNLLKGVIK